MAQFDKADIERRMNGAVESLKSDLAGLRTGRANTSLLDPVVCEVYGAMMRRAAQTFVLADHAKFDRPSLTVYGPWSKDVTLISDAVPEGGLAEAMAESGAEAVAA